MRTYSSSLSRIWQGGSGLAATPSQNHICGPQSKPPVYAVALIVDVDANPALHVRLMVALKYIDIILGQ